MRESKLETKSLVDAVADSLRASIFGGGYSPGDLLVESRVAQELGVHRPAVRAAMLVLLHEGIVRREANKSAYIPNLTSDDIDDLFGVRLLVESEAVRRVATGGLDLAEVETQLRMMETLDDDDAWEEILRYDFQFHLALVRAAGSPRLNRIYRAISIESRLALTYLHTEKLSPTRLAAEHRELYDALCSGDSDTALDACRWHLQESADFINHQIRLRDEA